ncbi:MAG: hypothetical protein GWM90_04540, partial [Gemmatimonadetes bacterium]|nr:hypothetical protein [Gemmatimonadota bacterium]NIQ52946.1 hypothetical protein [Gemmatimonadota bacterium]NIU73082.1 hypothetical protein [Gammaproteobacteria bacterium]NIX43413.1 hypothetical protein [Gemmatimonadota bacterium]
GLTVVVAVAAWLAWLRPTSVTEPERPGTVAVLPFRTTGADPALGYLREGLVDMLYLTLTGEVGPRAIPPRTVFSAWRRLAGSVETELSRDSAMAAARATGADAVIMGAVVGSTNHLTISASLMDTRDTGEAKSARVSGPPDSLPRLVEQLTGVLLSLESGQNPLDLAPLAETPLPALRAYLQGAKAYRRGEFDRAVD